MEVEEEEEVRERLASAGRQWRAQREEFRGYAQNRKPPNARHPLLLILFHSALMYRWSGPLKSRHRPTGSLGRGSQKVPSAEVELAKHTTPRRHFTLYSSPIAPRWLTHLMVWTASDSRSCDMCGADTNTLCRRHPQGPDRSRCPAPPTIVSRGRDPPCHCPLRTPALRSRAHPQWRLLPARGVHE